MTISLDELEALAKASCAGNRRWLDRYDLEHMEMPQRDREFIAACDPATILKLLAVVKAAKDFSPMLGMIVYHNQPALSDALAALDAP